MASLRLTPTADSIQALGLWLGTWAGTYQGFERTWLRFFDEQGRVVPTGQEAEHQMRESEKQRANEEEQRANEERQRADALAAEVARLKAQLEQQPK